MAIDVEMYRRKLIWERDVLNGEIGSAPAASDSIPTDSNQDLIEVAQQGPVIDVEKHMLDLRSNRLEKINAAIQSIDEGTYGTCEKCGGQIDPRRLDVEPAATTCMDCLSAEEQNFEAPTM